MNERLLSLCLLAYPRARRLRDGEVLRDLATELSAPRGPTREALGLIRGGLAARWHDTTSGARAPWGDGLRRVTLPLAAATAAIWVAGWLQLQWGTFDLGMVWTTLLVGSVIALGGAVAQRRVPTLVGALMVLGALVFDGARLEFGSGTRPIALEATLGSFSVDLLAAWIPAAALLVAAAFALPLRGDRRPGTLAARAGLGALPALTLILLVPHLPLGSPFDPPAAFVLVLTFGALPPLAAIAGALGARRAPAGALAAALALAAWTPEAVWHGTSYLPFNDISLPLALALWSGGGVIAGLAVLGLVKRAAANHRPAPE